MPVVFAQRGMTTLGKSLNVSQLSADPWEKFLGVVRQGSLAAALFFFFNNSKGIIPLNGGRHSDLVPGSPEKGPRAVLGDQAPQLWGGRPPSWQAPRSWFQEGQDICPFFPAPPSSAGHTSARGRI